MKNLAQTMNNSPTHHKTNRSEALPPTPSAIRTSLVARNQIQRHIEALHFFATLPTRTYYDGSERPGDIDWDTFQFKPEFSDLKSNGYVSGDVDDRIVDGEKTAVICSPQITMSGSVKLAELSEYLWKTSVLGRITMSLVRFLWLSIGVVIGYVASVMFTTAP